MSLHALVQVQTEADILLRSFDDASVVVPLGGRFGMALAVARQERRAWGAVERPSSEPEMPQQPLAVRVDTLERQMDALADVPQRLDRIESQLLQFREEVHSEFSAVRAELATGLGEVRGELAAGLGEVRAELAAGLNNVRSELATGLNNVRSELATGIGEVRGELATGLSAVRAENEETRAQMRALHEDVISRLTLIQDGQAPHAARAVSGRRKRQR